MGAVAPRLRKLGRTFLRRGGLVYAPVAILGFFAPAQAEEVPVSGLAVTVYNNFGYDNAPPLPSESGRPVVGTTTLSNINYNFDGDPLFGMYEDFIVSFEGHITSPVSGAVQFLPAADDGTKLLIDGVLVDNNWFDKGGSGNPTEPIIFVEGQSQPLTLWFYENGGGASVVLYWDIGNGWEVVPASAFTQSIVVPPTTTTTLPKSLGAPQNLSVQDTGSSVILTWDASTEDVGTSPERYAISWSNSSGGWGIATGNAGDPNALNTTITLDYQLFESTGGLDTEYQLSVRADNDTFSVYSQSTAVSLFIASPPPPTTTTTTTTSTTTTTTAPVTIPETTNPWVPETTSTPPQTTSTTTAPTTTVPVTTTTEAPVVTEAPEQTDPPELPEPTDPPIEEEPVEEALVGDSPEDIAESLLELSEEELAEVIEDLDVEELSVDAIEAIFSEEVLSELDETQINDLIDTIASGDLTDEQANAIAEALTDAPAEVKEAFEEEINVFGGQFDTYVPTGSQISVGARRVVVAVSAVLVVAPAPVVSRRR